MYINNNNNNNNTSNNKLIISNNLCIDNVLYKSNTEKHSNVESSNFNKNTINTVNTYITSSNISNLKTIEQDNKSSKTVRSTNCIVKDVCFKINISRQKDFKAVKNINKMYLNKKANLKMRYNNKLDSNKLKLIKQINQITTSENNIFNINNSNLLQNSSASYSNIQMNNNLANIDKLLNSTKEYIDFVKLNKSKLNSSNITKSNTYNTFISGLEEFALSKKLIYPYECNNVLSCDNNKTYSINKLKDINSSKKDMFFSTEVINIKSKNNFNESKTKYINDKKDSVFDKNITLKKVENSSIVTSKNNFLLKAKDKECKSNNSKISFIKPNSYYSNIKNVYKNIQNNNLYFDNKVSNKIIDSSNIPDSVIWSKNNTCYKKIDLKNFMKLSNLVNKPFVI